MNIRPIIPSEHHLLENFLFEAIFLPAGTEPPPRSILQEPEMRSFFEAFGRAGDHCLLAEKNDQIVGAIWVRHFFDPVKGYGAVDCETPVLAMSVLPAYRQKGIGSALLDEMLSELKSAGNQRVSLSVQKQNYAVRMYQRAGFMIVHENEHDLIMIRDFSANARVEVTAEFEKESRAATNKVNAGMTDGGSVTSARFGIKPDFLVETALLTHGLISISNDEILSAWCDDEKHLVWLDQGVVRIGDINEFLSIRHRAPELRRIDYLTLPGAILNKTSGVLTASGTMAVCLERGIPLAVTCGMGGIGDILDEEICPDLPALRDMKIALIATSPKDMLDIPATISWLRQNDVVVKGVDTDKCTGYIFTGDEVLLSGSLTHDSLSNVKNGLLILNPIPEKDRIADISFLNQGITEGKHAEIQGQYYHPAANAAFDSLTNGMSSRIQLHSLIANIMLAKKLDFSGNIRICPANQD